MTAAQTQVFHADAVLFDMDGTLTDSIAAVEAAWGKVARDIGQDPKHVIAATHGKRAIDNLAHFRPDIKASEMDKEVQKFEETILYFADAYNLHGPGSQPSSRPASGAATPWTDSSEPATPALSPGSSAASSRHSSVSMPRRPSFRSFANRLSHMLRMTRVAPSEARILDDEPEDDGEDRIESYPVVDEKTDKDTVDAWRLEAANVDRSVKILPGVKRLMDSIPRDRYAVATSGARTYAYGCMTRVGIEPPPVTVTADDKRLKRGKPHPDPFLLAAKDLGYDASQCVVFEDSPSGIRAGVASGAKVVAVCTSHERWQIENCGAHYIIDNMEKIKCTMEEGKLHFTITA
ncbi:putative HAD-like protein [Lyophyllum shimeji]|uniref:HAD-like protein n=1 Tax=Lyophyllum shimeji TaxID=47721 RepID=A0A9P3PN93_LYOSH|nr:putative HAD-like protein [Lyophyllum shimeji]